MAKPLVSVIMSCYNSSSTIGEAVDSILSQTYLDFELIIIDDASQDNTLSILKSYHDDRINIIANEKNRGLGYNLNYGVNIAQGDYIARMDSDDISMPNRLEKQVEYLRAHPDVICLGTSALRFGNISFFQKIFHRKMIQAQSHEEIKILMLTGTPMLHPSVMFNAKMLKKASLNYDPNFKRAQDYELWSRMVWEYRMENLEECLLKYRYSESQASSLYRDEQVGRSKVMYERVLLRLFGRTVNDDELKIHAIFSTKSDLNSEELFSVTLWLDQLYGAVCKSDLFNENYFNKYMAERWAVICRESLPVKDRARMFLSKPYFRSFFWPNFIRLYK